MSLNTYTSTLFLALACTAALEAAPKRKLDFGSTGEKPDFNKLGLPSPAPANSQGNVKAAAPILLPVALTPIAEIAPGPAMGLAVQPAMGAMNQDFKGAGSQAPDAPVAPPQDGSALKDLEAFLGTRRILMQELAKDAKMNPGAPIDVLVLDEDGMLSLLKGFGRGLEVPAPMLEVAAEMKAQADQYGRFLGLSPLPPLLVGMTLAEVVALRNELATLMQMMEGRLQAKNPSFRSITSDWVPAFDWAIRFCLIGGTPSAD